ncbi:MAG: hypothetical protein KF859_01005 [Phycisphaeraceae bacterium]|nr:hypothetical protein [Phycisphaeraceae bacterium]
MLVPLWPCYSSAPQPVQGVLNSPDSPELSSISAAAAVLRDPNATDAARSVAADTLVTSAAQSPASLAEITDMLGQSVLGNSAGRFILAAIAKHADAPDALLPVLRGRLRIAGVDELPRLLAALGSIRTPQAAGVLLDFCGPSAEPAVSEAAFAALRRLTARTEMPSDVVAWAEWLQQREHLSTDAWRSMLLPFVAARADRLAEERTGVTLKLTDALRTLHLATPAEQRATLLAAWLRDPLPQVRDLGLELVSRQMASGEQFGPEIGHAAISLLSRPEARVRASAAVLVRQLAPDQAEPALIAALKQESDPAVAADLLLAASRWPSADIVEAALRWLGPQSPARTAAVETLLRMFRAGMLSTRDQGRVLLKLRDIPLEALSPPGCVLRAHLGDDSDREILVPLLASASPAARAAVAQSLAEYEGYAGRIVTAARNDASLMAASTKAALLWDPTADAFEEIATLPSISAESRRANLMLLARALPANELLTVVTFTTEEPLRQLLLAELISENRTLSERDSADKLGAIARGVMLVATADLERGEWAAALNTIDGAPFLKTFIDAGEVDSLYVAALVASGQLDEAREIKAPIEAFLRGLGLADDASHAPQAAAMIESLFGDTLSQEQRALLRQVQARAKPDEAAEGLAPVYGPPRPPAEAPPPR